MLKKLSSLTSGLKLAIMGSTTCVIMKNMVTSSDWAYYNYVCNF